MARIATGDATAGDIDRLRLMRRVSVSMFFVGAVTCAAGVGTKLSQTTSASRLGQGACAVAFLLCGVLLLITRPRKATINASLFTSFLILGALMAVSDPVGMGPLFYLWPTVYAAYFFTHRMLIAAYASMTASLGVGLWLNPHETLKADTFTGTFMSVIIMAALVAAMNRREGRLRHELAQLADTDPLTGLLNRRAFDPRLGSMIDDAARSKRSLSIVMFDIDHFKLFNDYHGHPAGDDALRHLAGVLRALSRPADAVSRFGGEEFVVALPDTDIGAAITYAERIALGLGAPRCDPRLRFSMSAGVSSLGSEVATAEALVARADQALYAAKEAGRARTAWWDGQPHLRDRIPATGPELAA